MKELIFATANQNKVKEISVMLPAGFHLQSLKDIDWHEDIPETSGTIKGNAIQKATHLYEARGIPCFAEDTGLEVVALNGEPGVYSARYAGEEKNDFKNMQMLLSNLKGKDNRQARFKTVIAFVSNQGIETFEGIIEGHILEAPVGSEGFGYDPIFCPRGYKESFAQMGMDIKSNISHRALAFRKFLDYLTRADQK